MDSACSPAAPQKRQLRTQHILGSGGPEPRGGGGPGGLGGGPRDNAGNWSPPRGWGQTWPRPGRWRPRGGRGTWGPHGRRRPGGGPERLVPGGFWTFAKKEQGGRDLDLGLLIPRSLRSQLMVCALFTCPFWK